MNQQRSRRFRASQEAQQKAADESKARAEWEAKYGQVNPLDRDRDRDNDSQEGEGGDHGKKTKVAFDSNCITPGTPFMARLAEALRYYVAARLSSDAPGWRNVSVVYFFFTFYIHFWKNSFLNGV
jgi:5'-3' exoribonuclease 2